MKKSHLELKNKLREYRHAKGWSQQELAEMIGSSRNTIVAIENGKFCPTAYLAACLCEAFECKFEDLFFLDKSE